MSRWATWTNDGDLDLVCGNGGAEATVNAFYLKLPRSTRKDAGLVLADPIRRPALAKVNRDDRIDLVCGNQGITGEANTAYENNGHPFTAAPTWMSVPQEVTTEHRGR